MELSFVGNERLGLEVILKRKDKRWESETTTELMAEFFDTVVLSDEDKGKCVRPSPFNDGSLMIDVAATAKLEPKVVVVDSTMAKLLLAEMEEWKAAMKGLTIDDYRWFVPLRKKFEQIQPPAKTHKK